MDEKPKTQESMGDSIGRIIDEMKGYMNSQNEEEKHPAAFEVGRYISAMEKVVESEDQTDEAVFKIRMHAVVLMFMQTFNDRADKGMRGFIDKLLAVVNNQ